MFGDNPQAALRLAASLASGERAALLLERFGTAHLTAAIAPEGDPLRDLVGTLTAPSLEELIRRIDTDAAAFPFEMTNGRGLLLLPGIARSAIGDRARKQLELLALSLAESLEGLSIFDYADELSEGITIYRYPDGEPEIEYINRSAARRIRATPADVMLDPKGLFRDENNRLVALDLLAAIRRGGVPTIEQLVRALDGSAYWVHLRALPLADDGNTQRILVITSDITGLRASAERESILASCIDAATDAIAVYHIDKRTMKASSLAYCNQAFCALAAAAEFQGLPSVKISTGDDLLTQYLADVIAEKSIQREISLLSSDGSHTLTIECNARYLPNDIGETDFVTLSLRDVSERLAAERERRMLAHAIDESLDFFAIGDFVPPSEGGSHIRYINPAFSHLIGYDAEELIGKSSGILISPNNTRQVLKTLTESIEHRRVVNLELMMRTKDGRDIWCEFVAQPIFDDSDEGGYWLTVGRDITLRKQSMGQLALLTWVLDEINARVTIYEPAGGDDFHIAYENAAAAERNRYLFLELIREGGIVGKLVNDRKFAASPLRTMVANDGGNGVIDIEIRALFDGAGRLTAVITIERDLTSSNGPEGYPSAARLALVTAGTQNILHAPSPEARLRALSATLREGFDASLSVEPSEANQLNGLRFEPQHHRATMSYFSEAPKRALVTWKAPLGELELTTLRLALETFLGSVQVGS